LAATSAPRAPMHHVLTVWDPSRADRETVARLRDRLLGVGCLGDLVELGRVRVVAHPAG